MIDAGVRNVGSCFRPRQQNFRGGLRLLEGGEAVTAVQRKKDAEYYCPGQEQNQRPRERIHRIEDQLPVRQSVKSEPSQKLLKSVWAIGHA